MHQVIPPLCFLLALAMVVMAFSLMAVGLPEASLGLHRARASGDETVAASLEEELRQRRWSRVALVAVLMVGSVALTYCGFRSMHPR